MWYSDAVERLTPIGQDHLLASWEGYSREKQEALLSQIETLDLSRYPEQLRNTPPSWAPIEPFTNCEEGNIAKGKALIAEGRVGCLVLSGGQGSRLQFPLPKGMFPITSLRQKSLYQYLTEKVGAASDEAGLPLHVAFMTSTQKRNVVETFFAEKEFFGLDPSQVDFFSQANLPFLDEEGKMFFSDEATPAVGPNGNGGALDAFVTSPIFAKWVDQGIRYVQILQIDNPLADPFDAGFIGLIDEGDYDMVIKAIPREDPQEKVGVIARQEGKVVIKEYIDLPEEMQRACDNSGALLYPFANITHFVVAMDALELAHSEGPLPLHQAWKEVVAWQPGQPERPLFTKKAWKSEMFLFDILPRLTRVGVQCAPRKMCFAPLKNKAGKDSIYSVQQALEARDRATYRSLFDRDPPDVPLELHPKFYYPTEELLNTWKDKPFPSEGYLE